MRILVATDSFKETLTSLEAGKAIAAGVRSVWKEAAIDVFPMADGGEGSLDAAIASGNFQSISCYVTDALGHPVSASYGWNPQQRIAFIELAQAAGLESIPPEKRDVWASSTIGVGQLIVEALDNGAQRICLALGGSATNDAGAGMLSALGARYFDASGNLIGASPSELTLVESIDLTNLDSRIGEVSLEVAIDVDNPLLGDRGASATFGPQKGASAEDVVELDLVLQHFSQLVVELMGEDCRSVPGAGAAGGVGWAALQVLSASPRPGSIVIAELVGLSEALPLADLIFTGEGRADGQTLGGKTAHGIAKLAKSHGVPVILLAGSVSDSADRLLDHGIWAILSTTRELRPLSDLLACAAPALERAAATACSLIQIGRQLPY